jgi:hypothetical protein
MTKGTSDSPVLTAKEVCSLFKGRLGRNAVYEAIKRGDIPSTRIGDRIFVSRKRLEALIEGGEKPAN